MKYFSNDSFEMYATEFPRAASRAEPTPGSARGSALQLALRLTSRANPLLGSARATFCSARLFANPEDEIKC